MPLFVIGYLFLSLLPRLVLDYKFHRSRARLLTAVSWGRLQIVGVTLSGLILGDCPHFTFSRTCRLFFRFLILLLGGTLAGAAIYLAPLYGTFVGYALTQMLPLLVLIKSTEPVFLAMTVVTSLYTLMMLFVAWRAHREFIALNLLRLRNDAPCWRSSMRVNTSSAP